MPANIHDISFTWQSLAGRPVTIIAFSFSSIINQYTILRCRSLVGSFPFHSVDMVKWANERTSESFQLSRIAHNHRLYCCHENLSLQYWNRTRHIHDVVQWFSPWIHTHTHRAPSIWFHVYICTPWKTNLLSVSLNRIRRALYHINQSKLSWGKSNAFIKQLI